jgi:uncharacterized membrane-anchored protein YhcB (DUF1043 family)
MIAVIIAFIIGVSLGVLIMCVLNAAHENEFKGGK